MPRRGRKSPASTIAGSRLTSPVSRDILKGGEGRVRRKRRPPDLGPLFARLRRVELAICAFMGKGDLNLDNFAEQVLRLQKDAQTTGSRRIDQRGEVQLPQEGSPSRQAEGTYRVDRGPASGHPPYEGAPLAPEDE